MLVAPTREAPTERLAAPVAKSPKVPLPKPNNVWISTLPENGIVPGPVKNAKFLDWLIALDVALPISSVAGVKAGIPGGAEITAVDLINVSIVKPKGSKATVEFARVPSHLLVTFKVIIVGKGSIRVAPGGGVCTVLIIKFPANVSVSLLDVPIPPVLFMNAPANGLPIMDSFHKKGTSIVAANMELLVSKSNIDKYLVTILKSPYQC